jgi:hypothetical protein
VIDWLPIHQALRRSIVERDELTARLAQAEQERDAAYAHHGDDPLGIKLSLANAEIARLRAALGRIEEGAKPSRDEWQDGFNWAADIARAALTHDNTHEYGVCIECRQNAHAMEQRILHVPCKPKVDKP